MSDVIVGMPGPWADNKREASDHYTTKIGGLPDWPFPKSALPSDLLLCSACRSDMCLVAQVYAPIFNLTINIEERTIYVFCCISLKCGSYSALRIQKSDDAKEARAADHQVAPSTASSVSVSGSLQISDHNLQCLSDEEEEDGALDLEKLRMAFSQAAISASGFTKQNAAMKSNSSSAKKKKSNASEKCLAQHPKVGEVDSHSLVLPCFYTYDEVEKSSKDLIPNSANNSSFSIKKKQDEKDDHAQEETWEEESYEYDRALTADRTYLKFKKRMDASASQCFRYSFGGKPLLATTKIGDAPSCGVCGDCRHYEMQLMSPFVYFLHQVASGLEDDLLNSWNWMTLLIYTCSKSCSKDAGHDGWIIAKETVIAQVERLPSAE